MSLYRCGMCDELKDKHFHGCFENPNDEYSCICEHCDTEGRDENGNHIIKSRTNQGEISFNKWFEEQLKENIVND